MSKYSNSHDFKDVLNANFKTFEDFKEKTHNVLYQWDENGQLGVCFIEDPIDLIKYYSCKVQNVVKEGIKYMIYLEKPTAIQKWVEVTQPTERGYDEEHINHIIEQVKNPESGFNINDPRLIGAFMILYNLPPDRRYIV